VQPDGEPVRQDKLQKLQGKVRVTTRYGWSGKGSEEVLPQFDDGDVIITRNIPSSTDHSLSLQVRFKNCFLICFNPPIAG